MKSGIYCIENLINNKKYIGRGLNVIKRMKHHHPHCIALLNAIKKYGKNNFSRYVVEYCNPEELDEKERYYINKFHSHISKNGYNISWGGDSSIKNLHHTEKTKKAIGDKLRGRKLSEEIKLKIKENHTNNSGKNNSNFGKKRENASSKYHGVSFTKEGLWKTFVNIEGKTITIGKSKTEIIAAKLYDKYVIENKTGHPINFKKVSIQGIGVTEA